MRLNVHTGKNKSCYCPATKLGARFMALEKSRIKEQEEKLEQEWRKEAIANNWRCSICNEIISEQEYLVYERTKKCDNHNEVFTEED